MAKSKDLPLSAVERAVQLALGEGRVFGCPDDPAASRWPSLWEWLTRTYMEKGDYMKQPATLSISASVGGFIVRLVDRDLSCSLEVTCNHLEQCLETMAMATDNPSATWKHWGKKEPQLRKRKKSN